MNRDQFIPGDQFLLGRGYNGARSHGVMNPPSSIVPASVRQIAESGVLFGTRIDWRKQQVLFLALVPVDGATAKIASTMGLAFAVPKPDY